MASSSSAGEHTKQIIHASTSRWTTIFDSLFAIFIIQLPLFRVAEHFIGVSHLLKLISISSLVRMLFDGLLSECFSYLICGGFLIDTQQLVILVSIDIFLLRSTTLLFFTSSPEAEPWETSSKHSVELSKQMPNRFKSKNIILENSNQLLYILIHPPLS